MKILKLARRKLITDNDFGTAKIYILNSWKNLDDAEKYAKKAFTETAMQPYQVYIGFTIYDYSEPKLDLFAILSPEKQWSEIVPRSIRGTNTPVKINGFYETEQRILEAERQYRLLCLDTKNQGLKTKNKGLKTYLSTFPFLDGELIDPRCQCLLESSYKPFNVDELKH